MRRQRAQRAAQAHEPRAQRQLPLLQHLQAHLPHGIVIALRAAQLGAVGQLGFKAKRYGVEGHFLFMRHQHLDHALAAAGAGAFQREGRPRRARIQAADRGQSFFSAGALQRAKPVRGAHRAIALPGGGDETEALGRRGFRRVKSHVDAAAQIRRTVQPQQTEIFRLRHRYAPAVAAGAAARAALAAEILIIIRHEKMSFHGIRPFRKIIFLYYTMIFHCFFMLNRLFFCFDLPREYGMGKSDFLNKNRSNFVENGVQ